MASQQQSLEAYKMDEIRAEVKRLNTRLDTLEGGIGRSGLLSPNQPVRMLTAWAYVVGVQFIIAVVLGGGLLLISTLGR